MKAPDKPGESIESGATGASHDDPFTAEPPTFAPGAPGHVPYAYALVPRGTGRYVAVRLENVDYEHAFPADDRGALAGLAHFVPESRLSAVERAVRGMRRRTMMDHEGWK